MTDLDLIPKEYRNNPSARKIIIEARRKQLREGLHVGYYTQNLSEMIGVQPADDREYGEPELRVNEE